MISCSAVMGAMCPLSRCERGNDIITDFESGDTILLSANINGTGMTTFTDVSARLSEHGLGNTILDLGADNSVMIVGVQIGQLSSDDFLFG